MKTLSIILVTALLLIGVSKLALAAQPTSQVVFESGTWVILDHDRIPKPHLERIARGVHIDSRLLEELKKPQRRKSSQ
jgi:hypothetical protein